MNLISTLYHLHVAYYEIGELEINPIPRFYDYLQNYNLSSICMGDCLPDEIYENNIRNTKW